MSQRKQDRLRAKVMADRERYGMPIDQIPLDGAQGLPFHERCCAAKLHFRSRADARKWIRSKPQEAGRKRYMYECTYCGQWHLTSQPQM